MPSDPTEPVTDSCCDTVRDLMVRSVRTGDTSSDTATRVLTALGYHPVEVEDIVKSAQEAGA
jgi:hypothetical protein